MKLELIAALVASVQGAYQLGASDGSCYTGGLVSCNVDEAQCTASDGIYYNPGTTSAYGNQCCHCRGGCPEELANKTGCEDGAGSNDESAGACYDFSSHVVTCNVKESQCAGGWYPPGSTYSGCCFCETGCPDSLKKDSCSYYDANTQAAPPPPPAVPCTPSSTVADTWTDALNEPCYKHDGICDGYPVCCVTKGTCVSTHGGTVLGTAVYYEGGCFSDQSSRGVFGPGCGTKIGECNHVYLEVAEKGTTKAGGMTAVSDAVTQRLTAIASAGGGAVCQTWDIVDVEFLLEDAPMTDFTGHFGKTGEICAEVAKAAGVASGYVECTATDASTSSRRKLSTVTGVVFVANIKAVGASVTVNTVVAKIDKNMGDHAAMQAIVAVAYPSAKITSAPVLVATAHDGTTLVVEDLMPKAGLSTGAIVGIAVGASIGGLLILGAAYYLLRAKKKGEVQSSGGKAVA